MKKTQFAERTSGGTPPMTPNPSNALSALPPTPCSRLLDLRLADCMDVMREAPDNHWDLAIVDPPYGIRVGDNKQGMGRRKGDARATYDMGEWDHEAPPLEYFAELRRVSRNQIVWGANHFIERLPLNSPCWIVWDKMFSNEVSFAAAELAWTSFKTTAKKFQCHPLQDDRIHPTQKPVALYDWLLANYAKPGERILDTHMGSGSIAIACHYFGAHLTACEIDAGYYAKAVERIERSTRQLTLFTENQNERINMTTIKDSTAADEDLSTSADSDFLRWASQKRAECVLKAAQAGRMEAVLSGKASHV